MPSVRLLIVATLLAFGGVDAKKNMVRVTKWVNEECDGHPMGGKQLELKEGKCHYLNGGSIRVHQHNKGKYNKWLLGDKECSVIVYDEPGCHGISKTDISVPEKFEDCFPLNNKASSLKFWCEDSPGWVTREFNTTTVLPRTSYSIDDNGRAHPTPYSTTITTSGQSLASYSLAARAEPTGNATLDARKHKYEEIPFWAKHPWTGSDICYTCWTKKKLNYGKIECRSGPKWDMSCSKAPPHVSATASSTIEATKTAEFFFTITNQFTGIRTALEAATTTNPQISTITNQVTGIRTARKAVTTTNPELEKRSRHTPVIVENPYVEGLLMCADAEWEKEGKVEKQEIRLQKFKELKKCKGKKAVYLGFYKPFTTSTTISYLTATSTLTTQPTWAPTP
ncbi:hypothetical protein K458DRAFT_436048 [Lentithecium fluviatile CBS 122367]|uniref:Uncharacterized protein n=1 Tax=Lentithecium fluviatile CBS 122367 TaxID=1168545 RepID=A0A6G1IJ23_9PLEO|nr:hypothetical protein K458DRAFT_436048 [Lentithecium fluviatile CBS 122367]